MPRKKLTRESKAPPLAFQKQEILRCGKDPLYFINTYVFIQHATKGKVKFKTFSYQDDVVELFEGDKNVIANKSRQLGLSTVCAAYALWMALFRRNKNILVIANKLAIAQNFMSKVFYAYDELPTWLVMAKDIKRTKTELGLSSGSTVKAIPTSPDAGRSESLSLLIVDECISDAYLSIRNKLTNEVRRVKIDDMYEELKTNECPTQQI
jgi:hypothetical protein